ncbi:hypothetical protein PSE_3025 [Pseudovibrio sp. FO-BEG1]|uniref:hypothetical protein n=1 Tax=Pseudovibrio sp. (strain FO-BEG1) TaxID=911045 RepID=UPI000238D1E6|nr:hypothetical protein [Pseudovibrio sp. FO-BEG1]AEV37533.1 hypothetical protein PSE_3025 [Pseudovibrio sp. FO-BEG1]
MSANNATQTGSATDEPHQLLSKTALIKKYVAVIAFFAGGQGYWFFYRQLYDMPPILGLGLLLGSPIAIGVGVWLWPKKINIINLLSLVILINVGVVALFIGIGTIIAILHYVEVLELWAAEPVTIYGLTIGGIATYWLFNIIRAP